ncbi:MAG: DUF494 family protein [Legionellales bacterium]
MKDNLLEVLLNLFETSLSQLNKNHKSVATDPMDALNTEEVGDTDEQTLYVRSPQHKSIRVFTYEEQMKLTKTSYQFLMRMQLWNMIDADLLELILHQLQFSESRIVTLQETKWTIRNILIANLDVKQLAFLDLILYHSEDELTAH